MQAVEPTLGAESFSCPHCGALAHQTWFQLRMDRLEHPPHVPDPELVTEIRQAGFKPAEAERLQAFIRKRLSQKVFIDDATDSAGRIPLVINADISRCYSCKEYALWVYDRIVWPEHKYEILPNPDMPDELKIDFGEAGRIVNASPRGAAALLRLCIQKLCKELGEKGKNIDEDIASFVAKGLNPRLQKSLDIVRVVGNEAVHPGTLDLRDDKETAIKLFGLVNLIVDAMISQPKRVEELYQNLPSAKRAAIEKRDAPKIDPS